MIRGIIFDCFGVLYQGSIAHLLELTPPASRAELTNLSLSSDYGYLSRKDFVGQVGILVGKTTAEIETIMQADHIRNEAMIAHVRSLGEEYKIALLSNVGRGVINRLFTQAELTELFDTVVLSSEVGMTKPHPEIYLLTAERLGLPPEACMMVDDLEINVDAARLVGMEGIVFSETRQFTSDIAAYSHKNT